MTIPAAPAAPSRYAAEAWQLAYDDLDGEIDKWARRLANNKDPLTVSERNRLRVLTEAVRNATTISGEGAQIAAYAIDTTDAAGRASLQASLNALPDHVLATVAEDAAEIGWANVANRDAMGAIVQGRTGQLTGDFARLSKDVQTRLISGLQTGVALGEAPAKTAKRLRNSINDPVRFGQSRSMMIARTQLARAYDQASRASYAIARQNGVVDAWEWQAFGNACPICGELDGQVFDIEMDTYRHPNCRCAILPVLTGSPKAKQQRFYGSETIGLQTSKSGWTHWAQVPRSKRTTPPKQPDSAPPVTPRTTASSSTPQGQPLYPSKEGIDTYDRLVADVDVDGYALQYWESNGWKDVQRQLQAGTVRGDAADVVDAFDDAMDVLPRDTTLYRGVADQQGLSKIKVGDTLETKSYVSTTTDLNTAGGFSKSRGSVTSGAKTGDDLWVLRIKGDGKDALVLPDSPEFEVLLARNTKLKVDGITVEERDGVVWHFVDVS